jgi:hypothetical protein
MESWARWSATKASSSSAILTRVHPARSRIGLADSGRDAIPRGNRAGVNPETAAGVSRLSFQRCEPVILGRVAAEPPRQPSPDDLVVEPTPIRENHLGDEATMAIPIRRLDPHNLAEGELAAELSRSGPEGLAPLGGVDSLESKDLGVAVSQHG